MRHLGFDGKAFAVKMHFYILPAALYVSKGRAD